MSLLALVCTNSRAHPGMIHLPDLDRLFNLRKLRFIASGLNIKAVQALLLHASAKTTLDVYGHMWPDEDESARAAVAAVFTARADVLADSLRTNGA